MSVTRVASDVLDATGLGTVLRRAGLWHGVLVLAYHRVGAPGASPLHHDMWNVGEEAFDRQLATLTREADVVGVGDLPALRARGRGRHVLVTFDDGYRDSFELALPLLRHHGVPATFFVATGLLDTCAAAWWDEIAWMVHTTAADALDLPGAPPLQLDGEGREPAVRRLVHSRQAMSSEQGERFVAGLGEALRVGRCPPALTREAWMTWDMVRGLRDAGMDVGGHTVSHPVLARETPERQRAEVRDCAARLREELGLPMRWFSYPVGGREHFDATTRRCLQDAGVELAFSAYGGAAHFGRWDPLDVPRTNLARDAAPRAVRAALTHPAAFARW